MRGNEGLIPSFLVKEARNSLAIYTGLVHKTDTGGAAIPPPHILNKIIPVLENDALGHTIIVAPPGSAKTNTMIAYACWYLGRDPTKHIGYVSSNITQAKQRSVAIRDIIEQSTAFRSVFPTCLPDKRRGWAEGEWNLVRPDVGDKNPTMVTSGIPATFLGTRLDLLILDDIADAENMSTSAQREKVINSLQATLDTRLTPTGRIVIICVPETTIISTPNGPVLMKDINVGDEVISYSESGTTYKKILRKINSGKKLTYKIQTNNRVLYATGNHPILVQSRNKKSKPVWKRVDEVVVNKDNAVLLYEDKLGVDSISEQEAWLLGIMIGDGWLTSRKNHPSRAVCIALGIDESLNKRILTTLEKYSGSTPYITKYGYARIDNTKYANRLNELGLKHLAKNKDIPEWMFTQSPLIRRSFLRGLVDADGGWVSGDTYRLYSCNKRLVEQAQQLALQSGVVSGKILTNIREIQPPHSKKPILSIMYSVSLNFKRRKESTKGFTLAKIISIEPHETQEVFDIEVEDSHNFIADGFVVHNCTRWHEKDPADWAMKLGWKTVHIKALNDKGESYWPDYWPADRLACPDGEHGKIILPDGGSACMMQILPDGRERPINCKKRAGSKVFTQQYQGEVFDDDSTIIKRGWWKFYSKLPESTEEKIINLQGGIFIDTAHTEKTYSDYSVIMVMYTDGNKYYIEKIVRKRLEFPRLKDEIIKVKARFDLPIYIEDTVGSKALISDLQSTFPNVMGWKGQGRSKLARVESIIGNIEGGGVLIKEGQDWEEDFLSEAEAFPLSQHDDQIDALTMGLSTLNANKIRWMSV